MTWLARVRNVLRPGRHSTDLDRELSFHLAETADHLVAQGMTPDEAAREAARRFGHRPLVRERTREEAIVVWLESLLADLRYAFRALAGAPGFALVAVLSLGLGIGANTAIFTLVDAVILRSLPVTRPEQLVKVAFDQADNDVLTNPLWEEIRSRTGLFDGAFAFGSERLNLATSGQARMVEADFVSGGFFATLGVRAAAGRLFQAADDQRGCAGLAVVSHGFWLSEFGGAPDVAGKSLSLNGHPFTVVGVADRGFTGVEIGRFPQVYIPICSEPLIHGAPGMLDHRSAWWLQLIGRMPAGATLTEVNARLRAESAGIMTATLPERWRPEDQQNYLHRTLMAFPAATGLSGVRLRYQTALLVLMAVVGVVLLIACANVANLLLARAAARQREIAMRLAIGAGRGRIVRQMLTESVLLSTLGAAVGLVFARWSSGLLVRLIGDRGVPVSLDLSLDGRMLAFTLLTALATGILFGVAPAWRSVQQDPQAALKVGGAQTTTSAGALTAARLLVVAQVALSLVLVATAGLLLGTFRDLATLDPGFRPEGVILAEVDFRGLGLPEGQMQVSGGALLERLRNRPGIAAASASGITPVSGRGWNNFVLVDGYQPAGQYDNLLWFNGVTDGYFTTLGMKLIAGRDFTPQDGGTAPKVAIISQSVAKKFFGNTNPIGQRFRTQGPGDPSPPVEVIGVVEDAKYRSLRDTTAGTIYLPWGQAEPFGSLTYEVRGRGTPQETTAEILAAAQAVLPNASLQLSTLTGQLAASLSRERLLATLSGFFGGLALLLALIGLYGTMAYNVSRRRKEIGIRVALGATRARLVGLVAGEVGRMIAAGLVLGGFATFAATRLLESFLYGRTPLDPATLTLATLAVAGVALLAGTIPALRATRQDPQAALRDE